MPTTFVIFGASGDLTQRKLIPALFRAVLQERLPEDTAIVGVSRSKLDDETYRNKLRESTQKFAGEDFTPEAWNKFAQRLFYVPGDITKGDDFDNLSAFLQNLDEGRGTRVFYLATTPALYDIAFENLGAAGLAKRPQAKARRLRAGGSARAHAR